MCPGKCLVRVRINNSVVMSPVDIIIYVLLLCVL